MRAAFRAGWPQRSAPCGFQPCRQQARGAFEIAPNTVVRCNALRLLHPTALSFVAEPQESLLILRR